jgi:hypothetical protein
MCLCVSLIRRSLNFFNKSFLFLFLLLCYPYFGIFLSVWSERIKIDIYLRGYSLPTHLLRIIYHEEGSIFLLLNTLF